MYDPTIGRWISEDPIGFMAADTNLYRYVGNQPTVLTDPSGLQATGPGQSAEQVFGSAQLRDLLGLSGADMLGRTNIYNRSMIAAGYRGRGETLTPIIASAVLYGWERISSRGFDTVGVGALVQSTAPLETAADRVAEEILRVIDQRTSAIALSASRANLLMFHPIGITPLAGVSYAYAIDTMTRDQFRRLNSGNYRIRELAERELFRLFYTQPAIVADILRRSPTNSTEQERRRDGVVNVARMAEFERLSPDIFRKYAEAILREYLRPLPDAEMNRILASHPGDEEPNFARLMRMIRGTQP